MTSHVNPHPLLAYYVRSGLYRSVVATAEEGLKRRGVDSAVTFWKAIANANEGMHTFTGACMYRSRYQTICNVLTSCCPLISAASSLLFEPTLTS
jgi:hypothetical protein